MKYERNESYGIPEDNFEGTEVCYKCPKRSAEGGPCTVYTQEGMIFRNKAGHCPVVNRYASWHKDKPIMKQGKKRIGQGKTRSGGNQ